MSASGARVLRVEATPVERERMSIAQAGKLLDALDAVDDRLAELADRRVVDDWEVGSCARSGPPRPFRKRSARDARTWSPDVGVVVEGARLHRRARARARAGGC